MTEEPEVDPQWGEPGSLPQSLVERGVEPTDAPAAKVTLAIVLGLAVFAVALLLLRVVMDALAPERPTGPPARPEVGRIATPPPRFHADPGEEVASSPLYIPEPRAAMPIDQAMRIVAETGWRDGAEEAR